MKLDWVCIGPAKTGTTALADALKLEKQLYVPVEKEAPYFGCREDAPWEQYVADFFPAQKVRGRSVGTLTPQYFAVGIASKLKLRMVVNGKVLCILRDPRERLYSEYSMRCRRGLIEPLAPADFFDALVAGTVEGFTLMDLRYAEVLNDYFNVFDDDLIVISYKFLKLSSGSEEFARLLSTVTRSEIIGLRMKSSFVSGVPRSKVMQKVRNAVVLRSVLSCVIPRRYSRRLAITFDRWNVRRIAQQPIILDSRAASVVSEVLESDAAAVPQGIRRHYYWLE